MTWTRHLDKDVTKRHVSPGGHTTCASRLAVGTEGRAGDHVDHSRVLDAVREILFMLFVQATERSYYIDRDHDDEQQPLTYTLIKPTLHKDEA